MQSTASQAGSQRALCSAGRISLGASRCMGMYMWLQKSNLQKTGKKQSEKKFFRINSYTMCGTHTATLQQRMFTRTRQGAYQSHPIAFER